MEKKLLSELEVRRIFKSIGDDEPIDRSKWPTRFLVRLMSSRLHDLRDFCLSKGSVDMSKTANGLEGDFHELVRRLLGVTLELAHHVQITVPPSDHEKADHIAGSEEADHNPESEEV